MGSARLQFGVSEAVIAAIAWFIDASGPVQWGKEVNRHYRHRYDKRSRISIHICTTSLEVTLGSRFASFADKGAIANLSFGLVSLSR